MPEPHWPLLQVDNMVQELKSSHGDPVLTALAAQSPVVVLQTPAVHGPLRALQSLLLAMQVPAPLHVSTVQLRTPRPHTVPAGALVVTHEPLAASLHTEVLQAWGVCLLRTGQGTGVPLHTPSRQMSPMVHFRPSLHGWPFPRFTVSQLPLAGLQEDTVHELAWRLPHGFGVPWHLPATQVSALVQLLLSLQVPPSTLTSTQSPLES